MICLSESVRRELILSGCGIYWGILLDADKDKIIIAWIDWIET